MNLDSSSAVELARSFKRGVVSGNSDREALLAPPYPYLTAVREVLDGSPILLAGQDVSQYNEGAYTSHISSEMLVDLGCRYTLVGHSERREHCGDTDEIVAAKARRALDCRLNVILCVGEKEEERDRGEERDVVRRQTVAALEKITRDEAASMLVVAYEPVWAIGTGKTATSADAQEMHQYLRGVLAEHFDSNLADGIRLLYGGSVKPANAAELLGADDIDGVLVGGASLDADSFSAIYGA